MDSILASSVSGTMARSPLLSLPRIFGLGRDRRIEGTSGSSPTGNSPDYQRNSDSYHPDPRRLESTMFDPAPQPTVWLRPEDVRRNGFDAYG